jgi:UDPglucose 6-dehydrogenase
MNSGFKVCVIGVGYVGLVTGACLAELGNTVYGIDLDIKKIEKLNQGIVPFYEPGIEDMLTKNIKFGRLKFTTDLGTGVSSSDIIFIAVGTPSNNDGSVDVSNVLDVAEKIARYIGEYKVVVVKSTVPVGTVEEIKQILSI